jgi:hypothetical protein
MVLVDWQRPAVDWWYEATGILAHPIQQIRLSDRDRDRDRDREYAH